MSFLDPPARSNAMTVAADPDDPDALLITIKPGAAIIDPSDADILLITT